MTIPRSVQPRQDFTIEYLALKGSTITEQSYTRAQGTESVCFYFFLSTSSQDSEPTSFSEAASDRVEVMNANKTPSTSHMESLPRPTNVIWLFRNLMA